jgi:hypothetical protein
VTEVTYCRWRSEYGGIKLDQEGLQGFIRRITTETGNATSVRIVAS